MSKIHAKEAKQLLDLFSGLSDTICAPGRHLLFQESMEGAKLKYQEGKLEATIDKKRQYHIFLLNDAVVVGKDMPGIISTSYRARSYPLRKCDIWMPSPADPLAAAGSHILRARCAGVLQYELDVGTAPATAKIDTADNRKSMSIDRSEDSDADFILFCVSAEQKETLFSSFQFLKRKLVPAYTSERPPSMALTTPLPSESCKFRAGSMDTDLLQPERVRAHARLRSSVGMRQSIVHTIKMDDDSGDKTTASTPAPASISSTRGVDALKALDSRLRETIAVTKDDEGAEGSGSGLLLNIAALPSLPPMSESVGPVDEASTQRHVTYTEMLETEKTYVSDLQTLVRVFLKPLEEEAKGSTPIVSDMTVLGLFSNVKMILDVHAELLKNISASLSDDKDRRLSESFSEAFTKIVPFFRLYTAVSGGNKYCKNYWMAIDIYRRESTSNERFKTFLYTCSLKPETKRQDLMSFLIKPVQRICKYPLLFRDLLKNMEESHPNRQRLDATFAEVQRVAAEVNDRVKAEERQRRIFDVYTLLDGSMADLVQPQRKFILDIPEVTVTFPISKDSEGGLSFFAPQHAKARKLRLFLFTDIMIFAQFSHTGKVDPSLTAMQIPGEDGPLPGVLAGSRYKVVDTILMKDINVTAMHRGVPGEDVKDIGKSPKPDASESSTIFDLMATKSNMAKDGTIAASVIRVTFCCASEKEKQDLQQSISEAATKLQAAARDLQAKQLSAAPGRTRNWKKYGTWNGQMPSSRTSMDSLAALEGKYVPGEAGNSSIPEEGCRSGSEAGTPTTAFSPASTIDPQATPHSVSTFMTSPTSITDSAVPLSTTAAGSGRHRPLPPLPR